MAWAPPPEIEKQANARLQMRNAELPADLRDAETAVHKHREPLAEIFVGSLVPVTQAQLGVYDKYIANATRDLLSLFKEYDTLSVDAGDWVHARLCGQIDALKDAVDRNIERTARSQSLLGDQVVRVRDSVSRWASRHKQNVAQKIRFEVGESALKAARRPRRVSAAAKDAPKIERADERVLTVLRERVPEAAASYEQAIRDLAQPQRLSWKGPANDLREALRVTLHALAPADEVMAQPGFTLESASRPDNPGPTMRQRAQYILRRRGVSDKAAKPVVQSAGIIEEQYAGLVRSIYDRGNAPAHSEASVTDVEELHALVRAALSTLLRNE